MAGISAGVAYIDVLPNMTKFAPAVQAQAAGASGALTKFGKVGALAVGAVGVASVALGADFEKSMRNVNSLAQLPEPALARLQERVLDLAGPTAQAPKALAEGLYDLVSSGFDADESMKILKSSALAATAGLTTAEVSTKAVAAVLNAYRLPASKAGQVSDELFRTVDRGVISFEELATNVGDTLSVANSIKVPLSQVGAALATMTKQGEQPPEAATKLKAAMTALVKPSEDMTNVLEKLGVESGVELVEKYGSLQEALNAVRGATDGSAESLNKLFPNIRAAQGALLLTGDNARTAADDLKALEDSSGSTARAFEEQQKSLAIQWQRLKANLSVLAIRIGSVLIPAISAAVRWLNEDFGPALRRAGEIARAIGSAIAGAFRAAISWITNAVANVRRFASSFIPLKVAVGIVKVALAQLAPVFNFIKGVGRVALSALGGAFKVVAAVVRAVWGVVKTFGNVIGNVIGVATNLLRGDLAGAWRNIRELAAAVWANIKSVATGAIGVLKAAFNALKGVASTVFNAIKGAVTSIIGPIKTAIGYIRDIIGAVQDAIGAIGNLADSLADLKTRQLTPEEIRQANNANKEAAGKIGPAFTPRLADTLLPVGAMAPIEPAGRVGIVITNWRDGTGYFRRVAEGEVALHRRHDRQRDRMGTR